MYIKDLTGIVVFGCEQCHETFIVNTECIKNGFHYSCPCGKNHSINRWGKLEVVIRQCDTAWFDKKTEREYLKNYPVGHSAMSLDQYKSLLVDKMLGKTPKVPVASKNTNSFSGSGIDVAATIKKLQAIGFSEQEAKGKIGVAIQDGFFMEEEIVEYILNLQSGNEVKYINSEAKQQTRPVQEQKPTKSSWQQEWEAQQKNKEKQRDKQRTETLERQRQLAEKAKGLDEAKLWDLHALTTNPHEQARILEMIDIIRATNPHQ